MELLKKGGEGRISLVKRISDGKIFAAKYRFNPGRSTVGEFTHKEIVDTYKDYLTEVEMLSHNNHKNVGKIVEALRDKNGSLFIIMKYY